MPAGRPSVYDPAYCERVIEYGAQGKSRTWIAAKIGVDRKTIDNWAAAHPEFLHAITRAKALEQMWWEDKGQDCLVMPQGSTFSQSAWSRSMAARFPDEWREKVAHVGGDKDDDPIRQEIALGADAFTRSIVGIAARSGEDGAAGSST